MKFTKQIIRAAKKEQSMIIYSSTNYYTLGSGKMTLTFLKHLPGCGPQATAGRDKNGAGTEK